MLNLTRSHSSNVGDYSSETDLLLSHKRSPGTSVITSAEHLRSARGSIPDDADIFGYNKSIIGDPEDKKNE